MNLESYDWEKKEVFPQDWMFEVGSLDVLTVQRLQVMDADALSTSYRCNRIGQFCGNCKHFIARKITHGTLDGICTVNGPPFTELPRNYHCGKFQPETTPRSETTHPSWGRKNDTSTKTTP